MKLFFKKTVVIICLLFCKQAAGENVQKASYIIEVGKINIGILDWRATIVNNKYEIKIELKDKGLISVFYSFDGRYSTKGYVKKKIFFPTVYNQFWSTNKKKRIIKINFENNILSEMSIFPEEKERVRVGYLGIKDYSDPITSFLKIIQGDTVAKTIDGRRMYNMTVTKFKNNDDILIKKILIKNYINIWADHNKNDLNYIEVHQSLDQKNSLLPLFVKIKFKGVVYNLKKN